MSDDTSGARTDTHTSGVRTFLIADVRGYTRYSEEHGDQAASALTRQFANIVHDTIPASGGEVVELRGDEALCAFGSAREATSSAIELQRRFRARVEGEPAFPLAVGIGMDAGEAVPTDGGYKGRALNVAARLCSLAGPGEILASETVALLAGRHDRARYAPRRPARVKGVGEPVRLVEVIPEVELPPLAVPPATRRPVPRSVLLALVVALVLVGAIVTAILIVGRDGSPGVVVPANAVALIDPASARIVDAIPVGESPGPIDSGAGAVWVLNRNSKTLTQINPRTREVVDTVGLGGKPVNMSAGPSGVWLNELCGVSLLRMDPRRGVSSQRVPLPAARFLEGAGYSLYCSVNADSGSAWAANELPPALVRIDVDPVSGSAAVADVVHLPGHRVGSSKPAGGPTAIAVDEQTVWAVDYEDGLARRIDAATGTIERAIDVGNGPVAVAAADGAAWVVNRNEDSVSRIDARTNSVTKTISVGDIPTAVALGEGSVWVANSGDGTVSRIDPATNEVTAKISVGSRPQGITVADGLVWVTVWKS